MCLTHERAHTHAYTYASQVPRARTHWHEIARIYVYVYVVTILADKTINNKSLTDFDSKYFRLEEQMAKWHALKQLKHIHSTKMKIRKVANKTIDRLRTKRTFKYREMCVCAYNVYNYRETHQKLSKTGNDF